MKILHLSLTPIAGVPGIITKILNKYTKHTAKVFAWRKQVNAGDFSLDYSDAILEQEVQQAIDECDIIHFHNTDPEEWSWHNAKNKPYIIQLHTEPRVKGYLVEKNKGHCITIAQKHAILYKTLPYVPNLLDIHDKYHCPKKKGNKIKIVYTPTFYDSLPSYEDTCQGKGYTEVIEVLNRIKRDISGVEFQVIINAKKEVALEVKQDADIVIDECVTGGYHRSALEGLSMGAVPVGYIIEPVLEILREVSGTDYLDVPWINVKQKDLYNALKVTIELWKEVPGIRKGIQVDCRGWMEKYWEPKNMIKHYTKLYKKILEEGTLG